MLPKMDSEVECTIKYYGNGMSIERAKLKSGASSSKQNLYAIIKRRGLTRVRER